MEVSVEVDVDDVIDDAGVENILDHIYSKYSIEFEEWLDSYENKSDECHDSIEKKIAYEIRHCDIDLKKLIKEIGFFDVERCLSELKDEN